MIKMSKKYRCPCCRSVLSGRKHYIMGKIKKLEHKIKLLLDMSCDLEIKASEPQNKEARKKICVERNELREALEETKQKISILQVSLK